MQVKIRPNTIRWYIHKALENSSEGLTTKDLLSKMYDLGYTTESDKPENLIYQAINKDELVYKAANGNYKLAETA